MKVVVVTAQHLQVRHPKPRSRRHPRPTQAAGHILIWAKITKTAAVQFISTFCVNVYCCSGQLCQFKPVSISIRSYNIGVPSSSVYLRTSLLRQPHNVSASCIYCLGYQSTSPGVKTFGPSRMTRVVDCGLPAARCYQCGPTSIGCYQSNAFPFPDVLMYQKGGLPVVMVDGTVDCIVTSLVDSLRGWLVTRCIRRAT